MEKILMFGLTLGYQIIMASSLRVSMGKQKKETMKLSQVTTSQRI